jgi:hypothetical protein
MQSALPQTPPARGKDVVHSGAEQAKDQDRYGKK